MQHLALCELRSGWEARSKYMNLIAGQIYQSSAGPAFTLGHEVFSRFLKYRLVQMVDRADDI